MNMNQILVTAGLTLANYQKIEAELVDSNSSFNESEEKLRSLYDAAFKE